MRHLSLTITALFMGQVIGRSLADRNYGITILGFIAFVGFIGYIWAVHKDFKKMLNDIRK